MLFSFADIEIDTQRFELRRRGKPVPVEPLTFDLIVFLINHADELFNRDELINAVWQGRVVSDSTVSSAIKSARKALGDDGKKQHYIKTVHGRGFKFVANVDKTTAHDADSSSHMVELSTDDKLPSIIILGFKCLSDCATVLQLSGGLQANIETILTRVPLLRISADSTMRSDDQPDLTARQRYEQLGIDYVIDGMIQIIENRYRVNLNLTQAKSGFRIWSEQFEHSTKSPHNPVDALVIKVISKLEPQINRAIYNDVKSSSTSPNAKLLYLQASTLLATKGWHQTSFLEAAELLEQSRKIEPDFALAPAYLSLVLALGHRVGLLSRNSQIKERAIAAADCALDLDNMDSTVLGFSGCALADVGVLTRAFALLKNAIEINPANAQAWTALGSAYLINKDPERAIEHLSHGIKISPVDTRLSIWEAVLALAYLQAGKLDQAQLSANLACQRDDKTYLPRVVLAAIFLAAKQTRQAKIALDDAFRIKPDLTANEITGAAGKLFTHKLLRLRT